MKQKSKKELLCLLFGIHLALFPAISMASDLQSYRFDGSESQASLTLKDQKNNYVTRYRMVDSTCSRQVSDGFHQQCHEEPRQSCETIPGPCHYESRERCHRGPQVCHKETDQVCHTTPRSCHQVCNDNPSRPTHGGSTGNRPGGGNSNRPHCRQVCTGGDRVCRNESRRVCSPGRMICTPYTERVCAPDRTDCDRWTETVCRDVESFHTEYYACLKEEAYQELESTDNITADVKLTFRVLPEGTSTPLAENFNFTLDEQTLTLNVKDSGKFAIFAKRADSKDVDGHNINIHTGFKVDVIDLEALANFKKMGIRDVLLSKNHLELKVNRIPYLKFNTKVKIVNRVAARKKKRVVLDSKFAMDDIKVIPDGDFYKLVFDFKEMGINLKKRPYKVQIDIDPVVETKMLLNKSSFPDLTLNKKLKFTVR